MNRESPPIFNETIRSTYDAFVMDDFSGLMHEDLTDRRGFGPGNLLGTLRILR
jgi:hypothetical protein